MLKNAIMRMIEYRLFVRWRAKLFDRLFVRRIREIQYFRKETCSASRYFAQRTKQETIHKLRTTAAYPLTPCNISTTWLNLKQTSRFTQNTAHYNAHTCTRRHDKYRTCHFQTQILHDKEFHLNGMKYSPPAARDMSTLLTWLHEDEPIIGGESEPP